MEEAIEIIKKLKNGEIKRWKEEKDHKAKTLLAERVVAYEVALLHMSLASPTDNTTNK